METPHIVRNHPKLSCISNALLSNVPHMNLLSLVDLELTLFIEKSQARLHHCAKLSWDVSASHSNRASQSLASNVALNLLKHSVFILELMVQANVGLSVYLFQTAMNSIIFPFLKRVITFHLSNFFPLQKKNVNKLGYFYM